LKYHDFIIAEDYSFDITYSLEYKCIPNFKKNNLLEDTNCSKIFNECTNDCQGALITCAAVTVIAAWQLLQVMGHCP
jgi:hypothetical protein